MVYRGDREAEFEDMLRLHMERNFSTRTGPGLTGRRMPETAGLAGAGGLA